jgi:hypothetical protein
LAFPRDRESSLWDVAREVRNRFQTFEFLAPVVEDLTDLLVHLVDFPDDGTVLILIVIQPSDEFV